MRIDTNQKASEVLAPCPYCDELVLVDDEVLICQNCGKSFNLDECTEHLIGRET